MDRASENAKTYIHCCLDGDQRPEKASLSADGLRHARGAALGATSAGGALASAGAGAGASVCMCRGSKSHAAACSPTIAGAVYAVSFMETWSIMAPSVAVAKWDMAQHMWLAMDCCMRGSSSPQERRCLVGLWQVA